MSFPRSCLPRAIVEGDPAAADRFLTEYSGVISEACAPAVGRRAEQELEDFAVERILPRHVHPPRLSLFAGYTTLRLWLRRVVRYEWTTRTRRLRLFDLDQDPGQSGSHLSPGTSPEDRECLEILQPLFAQVTAVLSPGESVVLRMLFLDGLQQNEVARARGVNPSTITHQKQLACAKLLKALKRLAAVNDRPEGTRHCLEWFKDAPSEHQQFLGGILGASLPFEPP